MTIFLQALIDGLLTGGIYACVAAGLSLSYGVMRIFNWAQGDCIMMALYMAIFLITGTGIHPLLAVFVLAPIWFAIGFLLQKFLLNPLVIRAKEREPMSVLLTTAGLSFILMNAATFFFTTNSRSVMTPLTGKSLHVGPMYISQPKLIAFGVVLCLTIGIQIFLQKAEWGRAIRATSQDREVAQLMGMNNKLLYCLTAAIGFSCLGVAAGLMSPIYAVNPSTGATFGFKSMTIVVLGGKGSVPGALLGGMIIGLVESFGGYLFSALYAQIAVFAIFALVLFLKPNGLLSKDRG